MGLTQLLQSTQQRCQALEEAAAAKQEKQERLAGDEEGSAERSDQMKELEQKLEAAEADAAALRTQVEEAADKKLHVALLECRVHFRCRLGCLMVPSLACSLINHLVWPLVVLQLSEKAKQDEDGDHNIRNEEAAQMVSAANAAAVEEVEALEEKLRAMEARAMAAETAAREAAERHASDIEKVTAQAAAAHEASNDATEAASRDVTAKAQQDVAEALASAQAQVCV